MFRGKQHWLSRVSKKEQQAARRAGCLLGLVFHPEEGSIWFLLKVIEFLRATRRHIPESSTLQIAQKKVKLSLCLTN
jgi:hypothetical protein